LGLGFAFRFLEGSGINGMNNDDYETILAVANLALAAPALPSRLAIGLSAASFYLNSILVTSPANHCPTQY
jgi:hypothetical protein